MCYQWDKNPKHISLSLVEKVLVVTPKDGQKLTDLVPLTLPFCAGPGMCHLCLSGPIYRMGMLGDLIG